MKPLIALTLILLASGASAQAPQVKLADGKVLQKVTIEGVEEDKVRLKHDRGETLVKLELIDPAAAKQLGVFDPAGDLGQNTTDPLIRRWIGQAAFLSKVPVRRKDEAAKTYRTRLDDFIKLGGSLKLMREELAAEEEAFAESTKEKLTTPASRERMANLRSVMLYCEISRQRAVAQAKKTK